MRKAKVGDKIMVEVTPPTICDEFKDGDIGFLTRFDGTDWWALIGEKECCVGSPTDPVNGFIVIFY